MSPGKLVLFVVAAFLAVPLVFWATYETGSRPRAEDVGPEASAAAAPLSLTNAPEGDRAHVRMDGHIAGVGAVGFSGDGNRLVSGSDDHTVRVWDINGGREIGTYRAHGGGIAFVALNRDGSRGLSSDVDGITRLWALYEPGQFVAIAEMQVPVLALGFTDEGTALVVTPATQPYSAVQVWDVEKGALLDSRSPRRSVTLAAFDGGAGRLATVVGGNVLQVLDRSRGDILLDVSGGGRSIRSLASSPDGGAIAYDSDDGRVQMVRLADGSVSTFVPLGNQASRLAISTSGLVLVSQRDALEIWNPAGGTDRARFERTGGAFRSIASSPTEGRFATGLSDGGVLVWDEAVALRLLRSGEYSLQMSQASAGAAAEAFRDALARSSQPLVRPLLGHQGPVTAVTAGPDGRWIASGSEDGAILLWDVASGTRIRELVGHTDAVTGLAVSPDGARLVSTSADRTTRLWSVAEGRQERVLREGTRYAEAAFSPDGSILATGVSQDRTTLLWNGLTGDTVGSLLHRNGGGGIAFSPIDNLLIMRLSDGVVGWNVRTQRAVWQVTGQFGGSSLAISRTGTLVAYAARTHVALVDIRTRQLLDTLATPPGAGHLAFTPTDELLVASGRTVNVWDAVTRKDVASLSGAMGEVSALALSPDGTLLIAGSRDGAVWLWNLPLSLRASELGLMPWDVWDGPVPRGVGVHCDRRYGPGGVVAGVVMDSVDATPVDSALVSINGCSVHTDTQGNFRFVGIDPGTHQLSAYKPGWQGQGLGIESVVGDTTRATVRLLPKARCSPADYPNLPRIETEGAVVSLRLDDPLQAALDAIAPGFVPYGLDTYQDWIAGGYSLQCYQAPSAVLGDFNGDGVSDLAAVGHSGGQTVDLVLISSTDGYIVARDQRRNGVRAAGSEFTYYVRAEPGVIESPMELNPLVLTTHAVHSIVEEKASSIYYWRDGEWREYVTGD